MLVQLKRDNVMQGNILFPVFFCCCFFLLIRHYFPNFMLFKPLFSSPFSFLVFFFFYSISPFSPTLSALTGLAVHTMPSAFGSHLFPPVAKFFGFDPGAAAAGLSRVSPLASASVWVSLCPFGRATFIGWCPLEPPGWVTWSGAVTRQRPAGASVPAVWPAEWSPGSSSVQSAGGNRNRWEWRVCKMWNKMQISRPKLDMDPCLVAMWEQWTFFCLI